MLGTHWGRGLFHPGAPSLGQDRGTPRGEGAGSPQPSSQCAQLWGQQSPARHTRLHCRWVSSWGPLATGSPDHRLGGLLLGARMQVYQSSWAPHLCGLLPRILSTHICTHTCAHTQVLTHSASQRQSVDGPAQISAPTAHCWALSRSRALTSLQAGPGSHAGLVWQGRACEQSLSR